MPAAHASPIARPSVGRTFIVSISALGLLALTQLGAVSWFFVERFGALTELAKTGPPKRIAVPYNPEVSAETVPQIETTETLDPKDPFAEASVATASSDPIAPPPKPVPLSQAKLNPPPPPPENRFQELLQQGKQLRERGDTGASLTKLREASALEPSNPEAIAEIAITYERMTLMDKAGEHWRRIFEMGDSAGAFFYAAESRLKMSQAQAIAAVQMAQAADAAKEGPVSKLKPNAMLGIGEVARADKQDAGHFVLRVPIRAKRGEKISVTDVDIQVFFYDQVDNKSVVQTDADLSYRFASSPIDWTSTDPETLEVEYSRQPPLATGRKTEQRDFFGYTIRLYFKGELQDTRAEPESLNAKFPAPLTLDPAKK
jgi:hypothetical protein